MSPPALHQPKIKPITISMFSNTCSTGIFPSRIDCGQRYVKVEYHTNENPLKNSEKDTTCWLKKVNVSNKKNTLPH